MKIILNNREEEFEADSMTVSSMLEIRNNTSGKDSFRKRFFSWFNMFRIVKYLNSVHVTHFAKVPVEEGAGHLLKMMGKVNPAGLKDLLSSFRQLDLNG